MRLEARNLTVEFPAGRRAGAGPTTPSRALDDVSFTVSSGELVTVTGPNGSGKTTLLRALLGLVAPRAGSVTLDGRALAEWSRRDLAEVIGALPQREEPAFPLSVEEAVLLGRWARLGPVTPVGAADRRAIAEALARCDVAGLEERGIDTLSGGEWQRVRVARALAASPRLLLLDEPTAALDIGHEMELFELLRTLAADGLGVMVITHQLNLAARYADRMVVLHHGRAVGEGTPIDVLRADLLERVFEWPVAVTRWRDRVPQVVPLTRTEANGGGG